MITALRAPVLPLALAFAGGIGATALLPARAWWTGVAAALGVGALAVATGRLRAATAAVVSGALALGALHAMPGPLPADHVARLALPRTAIVEGRVVDEPARFSPTRRRLVLEVDRVEGLPRSGRVQLTLFARGPDVSEGQRVSVEARLRPAAGYRNPGGFDYAEFLRREDIHVVGSGPAYRAAVLDDARPWHARLRRAAVAAIERNLPPASAALLSGLLLGARGELPPEVIDGFRRAGVYHVLAVSGFNVALVGSAVFTATLLLRAARRVAALAAITAVVGFAAVAGSQPSVLRAVIMALLVLGALLLDREASVINSLALAAVAILAIRPSDLHDPGFQLSFAATAGIVLAPLPRGALPAAIGVSVAAELAVLPIALTHFNQVTLIGILANLAVVPLAGVATVLGLVAVSVAPVAAPVGPTIATWLFDATWPVLLAMRAVVHVAAAAPGALVHLPAPPWPAIVGYVAALLLGLGAWRARSDRPRAAACAGAAAAVLVTVAVGVAAWPLVRPGDGTLRVTVLDVGEGDVTLVEAPDRATLVVDGGMGGSARFDVGERVVAPFLWNRGILSLDALVTTDPRREFSRVHPSGLRRLFGVRDALDGARDGRAWLGPVAVTLLGAHGERAHRYDAVVGVRLELGLATVLLAPDASADAERSLSASGLDLRTTVLAVGQHGSRRATSDELVASTRPAVAVISVGIRNAHGHPHAETLSRLEGAGVDVYRTDRDGAVILETDGRVLDVTRWATGRRERYCLDPEAPCEARRGHGPF